MIPGIGVTPVKPRNLAAVALAAENKVYGRTQELLGE
jgi:hypothetical protein